MSRALSMLHAVILAIGAGLCIVALCDTIGYWGQEPLAFSMGRAIPAVALLALCGAYALIQAKLTLVAVLIPAFVISFCVVGLVLHTAARTHFKSYAPGLESDDWLSLAMAVAVICFACVVLTYVFKKAAHAKYA